MLCILLLSHIFPQISHSNDPQLNLLNNENVIDTVFRPSSKNYFVTHNIMESVCLGNRVIVFTNRPGKIKSEIIIDKGIFKSAVNNLLLNLNDQNKEYIYILSLLNLNELQWFIKKYKFLDYK